MRDRHALLGFLALIAAFPVLIAAFANRTTPNPTHPHTAAAVASLAPRMSWGVQATQAVVCAGLLVARRSRSRIEASRLAS